jgi:hypothetical protein
MLPSGQLSSEKTTFGKNIGTDHWRRGCQIFHTKTGENKPNYHKTYQMAFKHIKWQ